MEQFNITQAIANFMYPTVYTGVKPILLVAEELATEFNVGEVVEAVWIGTNSTKEFTYISKFAVSGKIILGKYYKQEEMEPFHGRVALINKENLLNVVLHQNTLAKIEKLKLKRYKLLDEIKKDFDTLLDLHLQNKEFYLFKKKDGEWDEELFSDFDINIPYTLIDIQKEATGFAIQVRNTKNATTKKHPNINQFYGYFLGSKADLAGLKLKNESYLASLLSLQNDAKEIIKKIQWLDLNDSRIQEIIQNLPKHPFENYFHYVAKENVRDIEVSETLVETLKKIILKHMPENNTPLGMEYILIDKLLYLFHMIIPREDALLALEMCDILYEPPGIILGHDGEHKTPPKYLVPIKHIAKAYEKFPSFMSLCKSFQNEEVH